MDYVIFESSLTDWRLYFFIPCDCEPSFPALVHLDVLYCGEYTSLKGLRHYITISVVLLYYKSNHERLCFIITSSYGCGRIKFLDIFKMLNLIEKLLKVKMFLVLKF